MKYLKITLLYNTSFSGDIKEKKKALKKKEKKISGKIKL